jgi:hypothetical protein
MHGPYRIPTLLKQVDMLARRISQNAEQSAGADWPRE